MKLKKFGAILIASTLLLSSLAGCSSKTNTKEETKTQTDTTKPSDQVAETDEREAIEVEFMLLNNKGGDGEDFVLKKLVKEKFNIDLKLVLNTKDAHEEKLNLLIASDELPDLIAPLPGDVGKDIGAKGALVAIDEHLDKMPNLAKKLAEDKNVMASLLATDGHIYNMPRFSEENQFKSVPLIRKDMLAAVGQEAPKDFKELIQVLKAIKAEFPDIVGLINRGKMNFTWAYGVHYGTNPGMYYDQPQDKWVYGPLNEGYKELVTDFHTLWENDLMDKEFFTASTQQWEERILNGKGVFTLDYSSRANTETDAYKKIHPEDTDFDFGIIMPLVSENKKDPVLNISEKVGIWTSFGVSADSKHVDRILEMMDWLYSEEAATSIQWGEEGVHYTLVDGMKKFVPEIEASYNPDGNIDPENDLGLKHNRIMRIEKADGYMEDIPGYTEILNQYEAEVELFENNYRINLTFTDDEIEEKSFIENNITTYVEEETVKFITGEKSLDDYDQFIKYLEENGGKELERIYGDAYARYKQQLADL